MSGIPIPYAVAWRAALMKLFDLRALTIALAARPTPDHFTEQILAARVEGGAIGREAQLAGRPMQHAVVGPPGRSRRRRRGLCGPHR